MLAPGGQYLKKYQPFQHSCLWPLLFLPPCGFHYSPLTPASRQPLIWISTAAVVHKVCRLGAYHRKIAAVSLI